MAIFELAGKIPLSPGGFMISDRRRGRRWRREWSYNIHDRYCFCASSLLVSGSSYSYQVTPTQGIPPYNTFAIVNAGCDLRSASGTPTTPNNSYSITTGAFLAAVATYQAR